MSSIPSISFSTLGKKEINMKGSYPKETEPLSKKGLYSELLKRHNSFEIKEKVLQVKMNDITRSSTISNETESLGEFAASSRIDLLEMDRIAAQIQECLGENISPLLAYVFGQISCNQHQYLSSDGSDLVAGLLRDPRLFEIFLWNIEQLISKNNSLPPVGCRRILEVGLKIIGQPHIAYIFNNDNMRSIAERVVLLGLAKEQTPRFQSLVTQARQAIDLSETKKLEESSKAIAIKGLKLISKSIVKQEHRKEFEEVKFVGSAEQEFMMQRTFFFAMNKLVLANPPIGFEPLVREELFNLGLRMLTFPDVKPLLEIIKIKKISKKIISVSQDEFGSDTMHRLAKLAKIAIKAPSVSLRGLQFLLYWVHSDFAFSEESENLVAGVRGWDPDGSIYQFAIHRFLEMAQWKNREPEVLLRLLYFIYYWREIPANQDWEPFKNDIEWKRLGACLASGELVKFKRELPKELFQAIFSPKKKDEKIDLFSLVKISSPNRKKDEVKIQNPLFSAESIGKPVPSEVHHIWQSKNIINSLRNSIVFYLLEARQRMTVDDLMASYKIRGESGIRYNQVAQFLTAQILASSTIKEARKIVEIICCVQKDLIKLSAYEAASAVHAVFRQASIVRLKGAFVESKLFSTLFDNPEAVCQLANHARELRELQASEHGVFEMLSIVKGDVSHVGEFSDFTKEGAPNIDKLKRLGQMFNRFTIRKQEALNFWVSDEVKLAPHRSLLAAFQYQSGDIDDKVLEDSWWARSQAIHQLNTGIYW